MCALVNRRYDEDNIRMAFKTAASTSITYTLIANFSKTKKIFDAYKASGYAKKFLAEHEAEILLHRSAKRVFQELNVKKLPTIKSLQEEYAKLLSGKKAARWERSGWRT